MTKHGENTSKQRLYKIWHAMHQRCENSECSGYPRYGHRGIRVCPEWASFHTFATWAWGAGYSHRLKIERRDNDGDYSPDNCRWATSKEQARNRSNNVVIERGGEARCLSEWAELSGLPYSLVFSRHRAGWDIERCLSEPAKPKDGLVTAHGTTQRLSAWAAQLGVPKDRLYRRLRKGWPPEQALQAAPDKRARPRALIEIDGEERTIEEWCAVIGISAATFHARRRKGKDARAPRGPTGPRADTVYRTKPGPKPMAVRA